MAGGQLDRDETLAYLGKLLAADDLHKDPDVQAELLDLVSSNMVDLYPSEWLPAIEDAFTSERAAGFMLDLNDLQALLPPDAETALAQIQAEMARYDMDDLHDLLAGWAMYEENQQPYMTRVPEFAAAQPRELEAEFRQAERRAEAAQHAKRKQKRKQAKASRKKNRKK